MKLESKILDEIISMLEDQEGEQLKKHPKLMAMEVEVDKKPQVEVDDEIGKEKEDEMDGELSPEILQKLLEMAQG